jgi:hypothetical protein
VRQLGLRDAARQGADARSSERYATRGGMTLYAEYSRDFIVVDGIKIMLDDPRRAARTPHHLQAGLRQGLRADLLGRPADGAAPRPPRPRPRRQEHRRRCNEPYNTIREGRHARHRAR